MVTPVEISGKGNPFYRFHTFSQSETVEFSDCCGKCENLPVPVCFGSDIAFSIVIDGEYHWFSTDLGITYVTPDGKFIEGAQDVQYSDDRKFAQLTDDLSKIFATGDCFRLFMIEEPAGGNLLHFSDLFIYIGCKERETHLFEFWIEEDRHYKIRLWCKLENSQSKTDKTEYSDANGFTYTLAKTRRKEYELQFDYCSERMHDAIKEMLMFPNIEIDDVPMYESGDYSINWDETDECGNATASTKIAEQEITKFSNCE
jgi:hypothetical protein